MNESLTTLQRAFSCLGHGSRLRIVLALLARPRFVTELATEVELSQSCTTRHLQALAGAGLVRGLRQGKRVVFEVNRAAPLFAALAALGTVEITGGASLTSDRRPGPAEMVTRRTGAGAAERAGGRRTTPVRPVHEPSSALNAEGARGANSRELEDFLL